MPYMQISNYRQGVLSPLDEESCVIRSGAFEGPVRVDYLLIDHHGGFKILWDDQLFEILSTECELLWLDEYEEQCIPPEKIDMVIRVLQAHGSKFTHEFTKVFVKKLIDLMEAAKARGFPVFFVL